MDKRKFIIAVSLSLIICFSFLAFKSSAMQKILLYINDEEFTAASPVIIDDRVYVPVGAIAEKLGAEANWDEEKQAVRIDSDIKLIASIPEEEIRLYALNEENMMYKGLILSINGVKKVFNWETSAFVALPELRYLDFNNDGKKELFIKLNKGTGTGIVKNTIHIINPENLNEYKVEDALDIVKDQVETRIISTKEAEITINGKVSYINLDNVAEAKAGLFSEPISKIYYENYTKYYIPFNTTRLAAVIGVEIGPTHYIGFITIDYVYQDGEFKADRISFGDYPNNF